MPRLRNSPNPMIDDILLEHVVNSERFITCLEYVDVPQAHQVEELNAKGAEIRPITETSRRNGHQFTAGFKQQGCQPNKGGIQIDIPMPALSSIRRVIDRPSIFL